MKKIALVAMMLAAPAFAKSGMKAAKDETKNMFKSFKKGEFAPHTQRALNALVATGVKALSDAGYSQEAAVYQAQWERDFADFLTAIRGLDLGDHAPLSQWLADFYKDLEAKLTPPVMKALGLTDIPIFNYGIPVVFQPKGDRRNGDSWDAPEYKLHFVPFAGATAYWIAKIACEVATHGTDFGQICGPVTTVVRWVTVKYVAPPMSDYVYERANRSSSALLLGSDFAGDFERRMNESLN